MPGYMPKSKTDKWKTPPELYKKLDEEFHFDFDPCPIDWKKGDPNGLEIEWGNRSFCNPPYSEVAKWIEKAWTEWKKGKKVVMLIYAITDTKAFHKYIVGQAEIRFIKGRVKFINMEDETKQVPAPKPSILVIFG